MFKPLPTNLYECVEQMALDMTNLEDQEYLNEIHFNPEKYYVQFKDKVTNIRLFGPRIEFKTLWIKSKRYILPEKYAGLALSSNLSIRKTFAQNCFVNYKGTYQAGKIQILEKGIKIFGEIIEQEKLANVTLADSEFIVWKINRKQKSQYGDKYVEYKVQNNMGPGYTTDERILVNSNFHHSDNPNLCRRGPFLLDEIYDDKRMTKIFEAEAIPQLKKMGLFKDPSILDIDHQAKFI